MATKTIDRPAEAPAALDLAGCLVAARERVAALEAEEAALATRLAAVSRAGDERAVSAALVRRAMLPHLLTGARREAIAAELAILDGQHRETFTDEARVRRECDEADRARLAAWEAAREADRLYRVAQAGFAPVQGRREELMRRQMALRRELAALGDDLPPAA